jgi:hypothetical protein
VLAHLQQVHFALPLAAEQVEATMVPPYSGLGSEPAERCWVVASSFVAARSSRCGSAAQDAALPQVAVLPLRAAA